MHIVSIAEAEARTFMVRQVSPDIPQPLIAHCDDGECCLLWSGTDLHVDIGFLGDGKYSYFARIGSDKYYADEWPIDAPCTVLRMIPRCATA
jgi:hypothetical protein